MGTRSIPISKFRNVIVTLTRFSSSPLSTSRQSIAIANSVAVPRLAHPFRPISTCRVCRQNQSDGGDGQQPASEPVKKSVRIDAEDPDRLLKLQEAEEEEYEHSIKQKILKASLDFVHEHGWTQKALEAGAAAEGLPPVSHGMFPRGGVELVNYFYQTSNKQLGVILAQKVEDLKKDGVEKPKIRPFIRDAIEIRLRMIQPYLDNWTQAMAIQTLPPNAPTSWSNLLNVADEIWYHAGDRSTDFNWYTKRMSLAGVYKTSEIFMLQDKSPDQADTWAFVDRRLDNVVALGSTRQKCEQMSNVLKDCLKGSLIMGRNMMGANSRNR